ncbi:MAG: class I adenylate-forming enzyme family protein [Gemmatimonadetes bacterium]|nr:class I adenylate-forming enzyme family protein [Gemmatimonadota bacterium]
MTRPPPDDPAGSAATAPPGDRRQYAAATPADDLHERATATPHATALVRDGGRHTFRELDEAAVARRPPGRRLPPGSRVTLCLPPGPDAVATLFGVWKAGHVAVPLHEKLTAAEIVHAHKLVNPALHIDNSGLHLVQDCDPSAERPSGAVSARWPSRALPARLSPCDRPVTAFLLTSGSSGAPRALGFNRAALAASASAVARRLDLRAADRWGLCLSLGHIGGLSLVVRAVMTGSSVRLWPSFDADAVVRAMLDGEVTHLAIVPVMLRRILESLGGERVPSTLRCVLVGGAAAPLALLGDAWRAGLPVATTWGMTETASQVATAPPALSRRRPGTVGRPLDGIEVRDEPGGNLSVRGPTLASVVIPAPGTDPEPLKTDAEGWFATRDTGSIDTDGHISIHGRQDDTIVSGGLNVSPREVERVIEGLPGVAEAVVFGAPDEEWGEAVVAVVEPDGAAKRGRVTAAVVDRHCRAHLARGRCPSRILVVDELPRTWTGKVMRARAAAIARTRTG